mmetsp:Transcript_111099/g.358673  ORF Transcript_111099/g.358673 Transcript_111099/m.358673 type:complete len:356 (-) Transcript_111099:1059-2126(-)
MLDVGALARQVAGDDARQVKIEHVAPVAPGLRNGRLPEYDSILGAWIAIAAGDQYAVLALVELLATALEDDRVRQVVRAAFVYVKELQQKVVHDHGLARGRVDKLEVQVRGGARSHVDVPKVALRASQLGVRRKVVPVGGDDQVERPAGVSGHASVADDRIAAAGPPAVQVVDLDPSHQHVHVRNPPVQDVGVLGEGARPRLVQGALAVDAVAVAVHGHLPRAVLHAPAARAAVTPLAPGVELAVLRRRALHTDHARAVLPIQALSRLPAGSVVPAQGSHPPRLAALAAGGADGPVLPVVPLAIDAELLLAARHRVAGLDKHRVLWLADAASLVGAPRDVAVPVVLATIALPGAV